MNNDYLMILKDFKRKRSKEFQYYQLKIDIINIKCLFY